jgi:hypothetical protein
MHPLSVFVFFVSDFRNTVITLYQHPHDIMDKKEYKAKPNSKSEKNKPKGGAAKEEQRAKMKAKKEAKAAANK